MRDNIDRVEMYRVGCGFSECADFCLKEERPLPQHMLCITPGVVNAAFACEVFLKLLLHDAGVEIRKSHRLEDLFNRLPDNIQKELKMRTIVKYGRWENFFRQKYISQISDAFQEWRYIYENDWSKSVSKRIEIGFLLAFRDSLKEICTKRRGGNNGTIG